MQSVEPTFPCDISKAVIDPRTATYCVTSEKFVNPLRLNARFRMAVRNWWGALVKCKSFQIRSDISVFLRFD